MVTGGVHGFPVVDVKVECYDGKYHNVDSSEMAFKTAAASASRTRWPRPASSCSSRSRCSMVTVPAAYQGDVMGDINARRGRVQGSIGRRARRAEITALVPTAEILRYAIDLRSMTGGRGRFIATHDHYDVLPAHLVDKAKATLAAAHS